MPASSAAVGTALANSRRIVLWFRNDLRLDDNVVVHEVVCRVKSGAVSEVLPVYCLDPRWFQTTAWRNGYPKTGPYRAQFLLESVLDLKDRLRGIGSDLLIHLGPPEGFLPTLTAGGASVLAQAEVTSEETNAERAVKRALERQRKGAKLELHWGSTLFHLDDVPFTDKLTLGDMPDVFTPFRTKCEEHATVRSCLPMPPHGSLPLPEVGPGDSTALLFSFRPTSLADLAPVLPEGSPTLETPDKDSRAAFDFRGGETLAMARLKYYLWESDLVARYFDIRNGMLGGDYSTKLAPALAHGCISPRRIYWDIKKYESQKIANKSTYWVIFELIWRDYFKFYALKHGDKIFYKDGPKGRPGGSTTWSGGPELLHAWKAGRTGWPLVDANMRELAATGFMSNRGRQNVASFLALDMGVDWRAGADWFESLLLDYDPASNWGNWVAAAGLTGGRINKFNIVKQSKDYDPEGAYIRHWCPELSNVPASRIHEPWTMSKQEQAAYGVQIGIDYPEKIPTSAFVGDGKGRQFPSRFGSDSRSGGRDPANKSGSSRGGGGRRDFRARSAFDLYG